MMISGSASSWKCFLCWKWNASDASICSCCRRERNYAPKSMIDRTRAQPLALHGLSSALHPFRDEQIALLASTGLDLLSIDTNGWTALHCAARLGQDRVVVNMLSQFSSDDRDSRGRFVEAASAGGWRALHHAIVSGHLRVVEELLVADADVNARLEASADSLTPLHLAARHGYTRIVDILLQCGADGLAVTEPLGRTALHLAIDSGPHIETIRLLCAREPELVGQPDKQGMTPLQQAVLLPPHIRTRREVIRVLETALREQGVVETKLLPAFLTK